MSGYFDYSIPSFANHDLAMLDRALARFCAQADVPLTSFAASDAATALVELFRNGCRNERQLGKILRLGSANSNEREEADHVGRHRIPIGSLVRFINQSRHGNMYRVMAWIPTVDATSPQYRIRNKTWSFSADECDLRIVSPEGARKSLALRPRLPRLQGHTEEIETVFPKFSAANH